MIGSEPNWIPEGQVPNRIIFKKDQSNKMYYFNRFSPQKHFNGGLCDFLKKNFKIILLNEVYSQLFVQRSKVLSSPLVLYIFLPRFVVLDILKSSRC